MMDDPLWYKDAVIYEVHVRAFQDGNSDGIGDFAGLTERLEYLADLGITAIWLLPFTPSPLRDDGYDIADYCDVHPHYGSLQGFRKFLDKAHALGMAVITELVINHTSDQHPWFQRARRAPRGSSERNFYVWSDDPEKYANVPLMFPDFETSNWEWDRVAGQYYWHRFYTHQPDLNFDNPAVWDAILPIVDFWFEMGVDGMRLDAVPYLVEREGTACEHLPETHAFLKALRKHVDERFTNRVFLAEANAWPDDMVSYFGDSDECHMAFHFPLMPRLFMALHQEVRFPITDILAQTPEIPANCQWCLFLRNHDELTLAMVTDEERDAMYVAYTRDRQARLFLGIRHRLAPLLRNDRRRIELMNAILFSLPGTPVVYYGDEIGMGDNIYLGDRNGVRTPMQWSGDRNAGFSRANSQKMYLPLIIDSEYHYEAINVETQQENPSSLLWWTKRLIAMRKRHPAFGRGELHLLEPDNPKILAYVRRDESECLLVVANLSRFVQNVQLDLSDFADLVPEELFGRSPFPAIREGQKYGLTLGPHAFYWFLLVPESIASVKSAELPQFPMREWPDLFRGKGWEILSDFLASSCVASVGRNVVGCRFIEDRALPIETLDAHFLTYRLDYSAGLSETLFQPLALISEDRFHAIDRLKDRFAILRTGSPRNAILCDPVLTPEYTAALLEAVLEGKTLSMAAGAELICTPSQGFSRELLDEHDDLSPRLRTRRPHRPMILFNRRLVLRNFRQLDEGIHPNVEVGRFLQEQGFTAISEILGTIEYRRPGFEPTTLSTIHRYVANQGSLWENMLDQASRFFEGVAAQSNEASDVSNVDVMLQPSFASSERWEEMVSPFLNSARSLAALTAKLHLSLFAAARNSALAAVPVTPAYQRSLYQTLRNAAGRLHVILRNPDPAWTQDVQDLARQVRAQHEKIQNRIRSTLDPRLASGYRIRCHGDLDLRRIVVSGQDLILCDFEGASDLPISERRIKRSPFKDLASLIRSFDYVANSVRLDLLEADDKKSGVVREADRERLKPYALAWISRLESELCQVYTMAVEASALLPRDQTACGELLQLMLLERSIGESERELLNRSEWAIIPLSAIVRLLEHTNE